MMSTVPEHVSKVGRVAFELERFELLGGDCCEVQGRWFGVRGRRFMRPALTVLVDGQPTRLLADLAHKPWAAEDGELWKAAFPCPPESAELLDAELTVAPDITIALPTHEGRMVSGKQKLGRRRPEPLRTHSNRRAGGGSGVGDREAVERPEPAQRRPRAAGNRALSSQLAALTQELADARAEQGRLRSALDRAEADKAGAAARIDELLGDLARAVRERDEAQQARDRALAERDAALAAHARAVSGRDAALAAHARAERRS